jgi:uncharacterized protein (TIGR02001 family)
MRIACMVLALCSWASSAAAAEISGDVGLVSDYRYRGVSLSRDRPAIQGSLSVESKSGLYGELWASSLGHRLDSEIDLTGGYEAEMSEHFSVDVSGTYYAYPGDGDENYVEGTGAATLSDGPASIRLGLSYVPPRRAITGNIYLFAEGTYAIPKSPLSTKAALGYERGAFDEVGRGGKWDWGLSVEAKIASARLGVAYVGSNADGGDRHALIASAFWEW